MAKVWSMPTKEVLNYWIESSIESGNLSQWETNFCESVSDQLVNKGQLSQKQCEILERIYAEKTK
jgi:hypothetical protein